MLANFTPFKDHRTLIKAWPHVVQKLNEQGRSAKLILAGHESTTFREIQELTLAMGVRDSIVFPGYVQDVHQLLQDANLAAFCSLSEGCPNAVLEGMAAGLPVVATDIPGIREAVGDAGVQYLVPPQNVRKLAEVITLFAMDPKLRTAVGNSNRRRIAEQFSIQRMNHEMTDLMNSLLRSK
jgi:glycosyltransferase involved in cell wall biosynthesis